MIYTIGMTVGLQLHKRVMICIHYIAYTKLNNTDMTIPVLRNTIVRNKITILIVTDLLLSDPIAGTPEKGLILLAQQLLVCHVQSTSKPKVNQPIMNYYFKQDGMLHAETTDNFIAVRSGNKRHQAALFSCYGQEVGSKFQSEESDPLNITLPTSELFINTSY